MDLSAQEVNLFVPHLREFYTCRRVRRNRGKLMDLPIVGAVLMLAAWVGLVLFTDAAGWVHLLLTGGMFLLIWRIVVKGTPSGPTSAASSNPSAESTKRKP
jgi:hypothetical protein